MIRRAARSMRKRMRLLYHAARTALGADSVGDAALMKALNAPSADALTQLLRAKDLKFFFHAQEKGKLAERFVAEYPETAKAAMGKAAAACRHEFDLLGSGPVAMKDGVRWHEDFGTGRRWKKRYSALLPVQYSDESDIKRVWELSRCQHFGALGIAHVITEGSHRDHREHRDCFPQDDGTVRTHTPCSENSVTSVANCVGNRDCCPEDGKPGKSETSSSENSVPSVANTPYAVEFVAEMLDWDRQNPPLIGPNWMSPMEAAIRIVNWIWGFAFMGDSPAFDGQARLVFYRNLLSHGRFIMRHVEPYGNHRFSNFVGLVWLGVLFPEFKEAAGWREAGIKGFCEELERQVRSDGVHFEGSIPYHRLVLEMAATTWLLLRRNGIELPAASQEAIERMFHFTAAYLPSEALERRSPRTPGLCGEIFGFAPQVGDADDGRLQELTPLDKRDHSYLLSLAAVLTGGSAPALSEVEGFKLTPLPHPETFWLLGEEGLKAYETLTECSHRDHREHRGRQETVLNSLPKNDSLSPLWQKSIASPEFGHRDHREHRGRQETVLNSLPKNDSLCSLRPLWQKSAAFPESGFYVLRSDRLHAFVCCRRPDARDVGAHSHNDHLGFTLSVDGRDFIVDAGTYSYTGNMRERNRFRATLSHNTIMVDEAEINPLKAGDPFRLKDTARCAVVQWQSDADRDILAAEHEGYARLGVTVRREFVMDRHAPVLTLKDRVAGKGTHRLAWRFLFAPEAAVRLAGGKVVAEREGAVVELRLQRGSAPLSLEEAWYSPSYGVRQKTVAAKVLLDTELPLELEFAFEVVQAAAERPEPGSDRAAAP